MVEFTAENQAQIEHEMADGVEPDGKRAWTPSAEQVFNEASALAKAEGQSEIGVRHLLGVYFIGVKRNSSLGHDHQMGHFGDHSRNQRRLLRRCPTCIGIGAPFHRNTHLGTLRRLSRPQGLPPLPKIRSLAYFLPVIEELKIQPLPEGYLEYLRLKLRRLSA